MKKHRVAYFRATYLLVLFILGGAVSVLLAGAGPQSNKTSKGGPLPAPNVEGLPQFLKLLVFARQNLAEGDFETALEHLKKAEKIHPKDPGLHHLMGLAYDGDRRTDKAFPHFLKAGELYFESGNMDKAWKMLGWLRTIDAKSKKLAMLEQKIRKKQEQLNKKSQKKN